MQQIILNIHINRQFDIFEQPSFGDCVSSCWISMHFQLYFMTRQLAVVFLQRKENISVAESFDWKIFCKCLPLFLSAFEYQMLWTIFVQLLLILYFVQVKPEKHNQKLAYIEKIGTNIFERIFASLIAGGWRYMRGAEHMMRPPKVHCIELFFWYIKSKKIKKTIKMSRRHVISGPM